jgi:transcriptional regulator with XRE-family HTH domain
MAPVSAMEVQPQALVESMAVSTEREVLRCESCKLVQFRTAADACRRCKKSLLPEPPKVQPAIALVAEPATSSKNGEGLQVASAVRDLRHVRNLSQRQLAARMGVPRTYISKIENGKAMPTLSSLDRLARALQVDISALLRDAPTRHRCAVDRSVPGRDCEVHRAPYLDAEVDLPEPRSRARPGAHPQAGLGQGVVSKN